MKAYNLLIFCAICVFSLLIWSCERDDICAEDTLTTPRLAIDFHDIANTDEQKAVRRLRIISLDEEGMPADTLLGGTTDPKSILLPLRFQEADTLTLTRYILEKDADLATDDDPTSNSNSDVLEIRYTPEFVYVSRACGYKSIFQFGFNGSITREADENNWIISTEQLKQTVDNEDEAHYILYH